MNKKDTQKSIFPENLLAFLIKTGQTHIFQFIFRRRECTSKDYYVWTEKREKIQHEIHSNIIKYAIHFKQLMIHFYTNIYELLKTVRDTFYDPFCFFLWCLVGWIWKEKLWRFKEYVEIMLMRAFWRVGEEIDRLLLML